MTIQFRAHVLALPLICAALSGCATIKFDPNTTTEAQFDTVFATNNALARSAAPLFGSASYEGEVQVDTMAGGVKTGSIRGGLVMDVSFASTEPFTATAGGFAGDINGKRVTFSGNISSEDAPGLIPLNTLIRTGFDNTGMWVTMGGTLTNDDTGVRNRLRAGSRLTGEFRGVNARAITGDTELVINPRRGTSAITGSADEATVTGEFYAIETP
ncbi:hypothetical protein [Maritimibacter sp. UBA3975]|uniref:hypothetical protein n=1 Tax=Maritimibacter sp. UBA3975 TaxID=1946833 RepID=UPI000C09984E|nr:hypothetical protein [Maritimibacter sp. UBA3975]MAM62060.1 hypothetical protein [Maritimibacter sp.]|tara:strand:+ start:8915 stop:9556 length:642 start_codon:yes stop_codon:yes gene_type:complete